MAGDLLSQAEDRCDAAGHVWSTADDPDCCPDCLREALLAARAEGYRAGAETMRGRCAAIAAAYKGAGASGYATAHYITEAICALEVP